MDQLPSCLCSKLNRTGLARDCEICEWMSLGEQKAMRAKDHRRLVVDPKLSTLLLADDESMLNRRHFVANRLLLFMLLLNGGHGGDAIEGEPPV